MNIKERVLIVQNLIDELQSDVSDLDEKLSYYNVLVPNLCINPMEIRLYRRVAGADSLLVITLIINFLDQYIDQMDPSQFNDEVKYLRENNATEEQSTELTKLREFFGV